MERSEVRMLAQVTTKRCEKRRRRKNKVSLSMFVREGLVGPKEMVKTASDGHMVNIP